MAVLTFGDVLTQCMRVTGIRDSETRAYEALKAGIDTAHTVVVNAAAAVGLPWLLKLNRSFTVAANATFMILPDGSTVTDTTGAIAAKCVSVVGARLGSTMLKLDQHPLDVWQAMYGRLEDAAPAEVQHFDPYGYNDSGQQLMWLMPPSGTADTIYLDYITGVTPLTALNQELIPPPEHRELVVQRAIAAVNARDTIDETLRTEAMQTFQWLWGCLLGTPQYTPRHPGVRVIEGQML